MMQAPSHDLPVRIGGGQHNGGAGVGVASDPGAVDRKQHQEHHQEEDHYGANVRRVCKLTRLVGGVNRGFRRVVLLFGLGVF